MNTSKHRTQEQRKLDHEFLARTISKCPNLSNTDYWDMLLDHIREREGQGYYTISKVQCFKDIDAITKLSIDATGINLTSQKLEALDHHDFMINALLDELHNRINHDRVIREIKKEDLVIKDINKLALDELILFNKLRKDIKKETVSEKEIRAGSDIKDVCETIAKLWKEKRAMLGIDAPKVTKVDTTVTNIDSMDNQELVNMLKNIGGNKEEILNFVSAIFDNKN